MAKATEPRRPAETVALAGAKAPPEPSRLRRARDLVRRFFIALSGLVVFIFGIEVMKRAALALSPYLTGFIGRFTDTPFHALAFGWITAYVVLSGSPIAALSLSLFDAGIISLEGAYFMIMGSRLGAAFIVIVIGGIALARGGGREESLSMGVLAFLVTYAIYIPAIFLGYFLLTTGLLSWIVIETPTEVVGFIELVFFPVVDFILPYTPSIVAFALALVSIYAGLALFDRAFKQRRIGLREEIREPRMHRFLRGPVAAFTVGALITLASTSVSLSLGMLVPLYLKGYVDRKNVVPYIMGANLTTFIDTLFAAFIIGGGVATNLVLIQIASVTLVTVAALAMYRRFNGGIQRAYDFVFHSNTALGGFAVLLVATPLVLLFLL